jgi:hypothetical protein
MTDFAVCWLRTLTGATIAAPPTNAMNSRRLTSLPIA